MHEGRPFTTALDGSVRPVGVIPQDVALRMQLACIAGSEPAGSFLEIRPLGLRMEPAPAARAWIPVRDVDAAVAWIHTHTAALNVFIGVAPRVRAGGKAEDVERVHCLWADCDTPEALARLRAFRPLPSIVIRSGSDDAAHGYWALRAPLSPAWAQRANRRLALALGADRQACDPARILRPAGTLNYKHDPARRVTCARLELDVFDWGDVVGALPDDRAYEPTRRGDREHQPVGDPSKLVEAIVRVVAEKPEGERNDALFWAAARISEKGAAGEISEESALEELRAAAIHVGLGEAEIEKTISSGLAAGRRAA